MILDVKKTPFQTFDCIPAACAAALQSLIPAGDTDEPSQPEKSDDSQ